MSNIVIIGAQWGDEGKGKIVDLLSEKADVVVRFQGGHNAGHTLVVQENEFKLSLLPSGIIRDSTMSVIGNGVVIDPFHLIKEIAEIENKGIKITPDKLIISENCFLILPIHKFIDQLREKKISSLKTKIGTTGRGIGPAYEDKVARRGIRIDDLKNKNIFLEKIKNIYDHHNIWITHHELKKINFEIDFEKLLKAYEVIKPFVKNSWRELDTFVEKRKNILFEGAQGTFLDIDFGTYPYVTSSNTIAGNAAIGSGVGPSKINYTIGITKAYTTRVGNGPFPTELDNEIGQKLALKGKEFGTVTGRKRRCGWFDAVLIKQAVKISGLSGLALTKLDVLDEFEEIKICIGYELEGIKINYLPICEFEQNRVKPIYLSLKGWKSKTLGTKTLSELPSEAIVFIQKIKEVVGCDIDIISTGPERNDTIFLKKIFN